MKKRHQLLKQTVFGVVVFFILLEVILRLWNPAFLASGYQDLNGSSTKLFQDDPELGWKYKPDKLVRYFGPEYDITLRTNAWGFRSDRTDGQWLFTGDSFTMGCCVNQSDSFAEASGALFGKTVLNLGVEGYGTDQALWSYEQYGQNASEAVVFYAFYINDLDDIANANTKPAYLLQNGTLEKINFPFKKSFVSSAKNALYEISYTFRVFIQLLERQPALKGFLANAARLRFSEAFSVLSKPSGGIPNEVQDLLTPLPIERQARLELVDAIIRQYTFEVREHNATFVIVLLPSKLQTDFQNVTRKVEVAYGVTLHQEQLFDHFVALGQKEGFRVINLLPVFDESVKKGEKPYFDNDGHWTKFGHQLAAKIITDAMKTVPSS